MMRDIAGMICKACLGLGAVGLVAFVLVIELIFAGGLLFFVGGLTIAPWYNVWTPGGVDYVWLFWAIVFDLLAIGAFGLFLAKITGRWE